MDAIANEIQFLSHLAPVWSLLPDRGTFYVHPSLIDHARSRGIEAVPVDPLNINRGGIIRPNLGANRPALVASWGDIKEARRMGYGPLVYLEHGAGQSYGGDLRSPWVRHESYAGGKGHEDVALYLVPNYQCAAKWWFAYPDARVEVVGSPRLDGLPRRIPDGQVTVAISFHFNASRVAPEAGTALGEFGPVLAALAKRFHVIGHEHPRWRMEGHSLERDYRRMGIEYVGDFDEVCRRADVYVCDNSSTIPEFASTGRPVVLMNSRHYRKDVHHGGRFWDWAHIGIQVDVPADLGDMIELALEDPPSVAIAREDALSIVYQPRTGGAAYAVTAITDWLASRTEERVA